MRQGITVFLDVPLDALARRIAAVGTDSRPLLHFKSGDAYTKVAINSTNLKTLSLDSDFRVGLEKGSNMWHPQLPCRLLWDCLLLPRRDLRHMLMLMLRFPFYVWLLLSNIVNFLSTFSCNLVNVRIHGHGCICHFQENGSFDWLIMNRLR